MKKLLALLMVLVMALGLAACGGNKLVGEWEATLELADAINAQFASEDPAVAEYLSVDEFNIKLTMTFDKDGTYSMEVDEDSVEEAVEALKTSMSSGMRRYMEAMIEDTGVNMTVDELLQSQNTTLDELIESAFGAEMVEAMVGEMNVKGQYLVEDGKLYTNDDEDEEIDTDKDEAADFELDGDELKLEAPDDSDDEEMMDELFPLELKRVN